MATSDVMLQFINELEAFEVPDWFITDWLPTKLGSSRAAYLLCLVIATPFVLD
jgi:hypothetical protein